MTISGGARIDRWGISEGHLRENVLASGASLREETYDDREGWLPTTRAGAIFELGGGFGFRTATYLGWRMPTLNELFARSVQVRTRRLPIQT